MIFIDETMIEAFLQNLNLQIATLNSQRVLLNRGNREEYRKGDMLSFLVEGCSVLASIR